MVNKIKTMLKWVKRILIGFVLLISIFFMLAGLSGVDKDGTPLSSDIKFAFIFISILLALPIFLIYIRKIRLKFMSVKFDKPQHAETKTPLYSFDLTPEMIYAINNGLDEYIWDLASFLVEKDKASIGMIQRIYHIGFNRAAILMDQLYILGIVGPDEGTSPRKVLMSIDKLEAYTKFLDEKKEVMDLWIQADKKALLDLELEKKFDRINMYNNQFDNMTGEDFEEFCSRLFKSNGFGNVEITQGSYDQGVDILALKEGIKYAIQCKRYSSNVGNDAIQQIAAGKKHYNCHVAVVITNQYFTSSAIELAKSNNVLLWDRDKLIELIKELPSD